jgi:hypothetical protein
VFAGGGYEVALFDAAPGAEHAPINESRAHPDSIGTDVL